MRPAIAVIDSVLVGKGLKTLGDMERSSRDPGKANEELLKLYKEEDPSRIFCRNMP